MIKSKSRKTVLLFVFSVVVTVLFFPFFNGISIGNYGINKTVGWAWDLVNILPIPFGITLLSSLWGYLIMYAVKARFSKKVLILNIAFLLGAIISVFFLRMTLSITFILTIALILLAMLMLYTNIIIALVRAKDRK